MQSTVIDSDFAVAAQITMADIARMASEGVKTLINNRPDNEEPGQLSAAEARAEAERLGLSYLHIPVQTGSIRKADLDAFAEALADSPKPILAHCRSGTRCYLLWAATKAHQGAEVGQLVQRAAEDGYDIRILPEILRRAGVS